MAFYQLPRLNEVVKWRPDQPATVVRFTAGGGLALLHATANPDLTPKAWQVQALQLGLAGTAPAPGRYGRETPPVVPPLLCLRVGVEPAVAAPVCIFELNEPGHIYEWLNARAMPAELRLVLLRLNPKKPGQATVEASRRIWAPEWATGDELLRLCLEQQCLDTAEEDAGQVQAAGRQKARYLAAADVLARVDFRLDVPGEGPTPLIPTAGMATIQTN